MAYSLLLEMHPVSVSDDNALNVNIGPICKICVTDIISHVLRV